MSYYKTFTIKCEKFLKCSQSTINKLLSSLYLLNYVLNNFFLLKKTHLSSFFSKVSSLSLNNYCPEQNQMSHVRRMGLSHRLLFVHLLGHTQCRRISAAIGRRLQLKPIRWLDASAPNRYVCVLFSSSHAFWSSIQFYMIISGLAGCAYRLLWERSAFFLLCFLESHV